MSDAFVKGLKRALAIKKSNSSTKLTNPLQFKAVARVPPELNESKYKTIIIGKMIELIHRKRNEE